MQEWRHRLLVLFLSSWGFACPAIAAGYDTLSIGKLSQEKRKPCTFIHVWAGWCEPCVSELPDLVSTLARIKKLNPVIIDVSPPDLQRQFSRGFLERIHPRFRTFRKPAGSEEAYLMAIEPDWAGALPYSVLYDGGRKKKEWVGTIDLRKLRREIDAACKVPTT